MTQPDSNSAEVRIPLPGSVSALLDAVRDGVRRNASLMGLILLTLFGAVLFWLTSGLDLGWFALQKLELPVGLRAIILAIVVPGALWLLFSRVLFPWFRSIRQDDVAALIERRFPVFENRLMTCVHASHGYPDDGPAVGAMLRRAVNEAEQIAVNVNAGEIFDSTHLKRRGSVAGVLVVAIAVLAIASPQAVTRWWKAFVRCEPTYHIRTTQLEIAVIAQPGDRRVAFQREDEQFVYLHPRSTDLVLEMTVPEGVSEKGQEWVIPERVRVDVLRNDGSRSRSFVSRTGERAFRFTLTRLQDDVRIELLAGDYRTVIPYQIRCVDPPGIDSITLRCRYPEYTGWNELREPTVPVLGSEATLPLFTEFELIAVCNKALQSGRIVTEAFEITGDQELSRLTSRTDGANGLVYSEPLLQEDGRTIRIQLRLLADQTDEASDASQLEGQSADFLPVASNTALRFFLHDADGVLSTTPEVLRLRGTADQPPVITSSLQGVGNAVTRLARIPVTGTVRDDYGIAGARFEFRVDDESNWRPRPFRRQPTAGVTEFELSRSEQEPFEVFDLQPLDLTEGQSLILTVAASDQNNITGPGASRSDPIPLRIVSNEELLSLLYTREINLRRRFEDVIQQLQQTHDDLVFHREIAARLDTGDENVIRDDDSVAVNTCATRTSNNLRRQQNELLAIVSGFDEIIQQLINNAVPPQQLAENMRKEILQPLQRAANTAIPKADRAVSLFRVATRRQQESEPLLVAATEEFETLLRDLRRILESVRDMAEFHEALRDLKSILEEQERLLDETRQMQKRNLIDKLKLLE